MNGITDRDANGRTVYENAERLTLSVIEDAIRHEGLRQRNPEWDVHSEVYGKSVGRVEEFMIAGNGPSAWLCFVLDADGDLHYAYLRYVAAGEPALVHLGQYDGEELYKAVKGYR